MWISTQLLRRCPAVFLHLQFSGCHSILMLFFKLQGFFIIPNLNVIWNIIGTSEAISHQTPPEKLSSEVSIKKV